MKYIDLRIFLISLLVGLLFVYLVDSPTKEVFVFPTPENIGQVQFVDNTKTCFDFEPTEVKCPADNGDVKDYDVQ